jgi:hypothetical protein
MSDETADSITLEPDRFQTTEVNANGQIYLGRDLSGKTVHLAIEIVEESEQ